MKRILILGLTLAAGVTILLRLTMGPAALVPALVFSLVAVGVQVASARLLVGSGGLTHQKFLVRWGAGMGLRFGGALLFVLAVAIDRTLFPPLPAAFGYIGVVVPLLFLELRAIR